MHELVLIESASARNEKLSEFSQDTSLNCLTKAKSLVMAMWQGTGIATSQQMADYYEAPIDTVQTVIKNNRDELVSDGLRKVTAKELKALRSLGLSNLDIPDSTTVLTLWTARAALRLGMLLRDSEVAKQVRTVLLDVAEVSTQPKKNVKLLAEAKPNSRLDRSGAVVFGKYLRQERLRQGVSSVRRLVELIDEYVSLPTGLATEKQIYNLETATKAQSFNIFELGAIASYALFLFEQDPNSLYLINPKYKRPYTAKELGAIGMQWINPETGEIYPDLDLDPNIYKFLSL